MAKLLGKPKLIPPFCCSTFKRQDILPAQLPMPMVPSIPPSMPSILHTCWRILTACNEFVSYASQNGTKWLWWFVQLKKRTFWHAIKAKKQISSLKQAAIREMQLHMKGFISLSIKTWWSYWQRKMRHTSLSWYPVTFETVLEWMRRENEWKWW